MLRVVLLEVVLQASKTHPSPHRNTMLLKDGTTSKNMLPRGLTSLLDSGKKKEIAAAGPAAAAGAATRGGAASLQNAPFATPKHHATEGRNDLQINRKNKFPGGRNVPSEILSLILSCYRARILSYPAILLGPPKTCCPGAWRPFWILEKKRDCSSSSSSNSS